MIFKKDDQYCKYANFDKTYPIRVKNYYNINLNFVPGKSLYYTF